MAKATFNGTTIAESDDIIELEGRVYFPKSSVKMEFLKKTEETYTCAWKGTCEYYDVEVDGKTEAGAAWMYPEPTEAAEKIKGFVAFWKGIKITK